VGVPRGVGRSGYAIPYPGIWGASWQQMVDAGLVRAPDGSIYTQDNLASWPAWLRAVTGY
jgi:hypothetical protein